MISIVICSINDVFARQVKRNIDNTIGVEWEPIIIENRLQPRSIAEVYNLGASRANYNLICFVHEDVLFETNNWGQKIIEYFKNDVNLGLIGVAGSKYKSKTVSGWYTGIPEFDCANIGHLDAGNEIQRINFNPLPGTDMQDVVCLDGVFMISTKPVWQEVRFDQNLLQGFHLYDLDFSIRVGEKYKVVVTFEIDIIHIVKGMHFGNEWLENTLLWHRSNNERLPVSIHGLGLKHARLERKIRKTWLIRLKHEQLAFYNKLRWLAAIKIWIHFSEWPYIILFLIKTNRKKSKVKI